MSVTRPRSFEPIRVFAYQQGGKQQEDETNSNKVSGVTSKSDPMAIQFAATVESLLDGSRELGPYCFVVLRRRPEFELMPKSSHTNGHSTCCTFRKLQITTPANNISAYV